MKSKLKYVKKLVKVASRLRNWASKNWLKYTIIKNLYFVLLFPLMFLSRHSSFFGILFVIAIFIGILTFLLLDSKRISVALEYPDVLIKTERLENLFSNIFYIFYVMLILSIVLLANSQKLNINTEVMSTVTISIIFIWMGTLVNFELSWLESSYIMKSFAKKFATKKTHHLFDFIPSDVIRAKARFSVVSRILSKNPSKGVINSKFPLFWEGITIYNTHIRKEFKFVIRDPKRFYFYAKLSTYYEPNNKAVKTHMDSLVALMEGEKDQPFEFIRLLKAIVNEPTSSEEVFKEIDVEPKLIRNWFSAHSDSTKVVIAIISPIISIILAIFR